MKKLTVHILLLISCLSFSQTFNTGKVVAIKDGDTVIVIDTLNNQYTLRLAEVDCPEKNQPFGTKAKQFTSDEIYLKKIKYLITEYDKYGRSIAMIYYDDDNKYLSAEIIKAGMGWHYKRYSKSKELALFEEEAKKNKKGLWVDSDAVEPSKWRNN